jgi:DNA-directed RNA polymerase subunit RPC12/RpoP
LERASATRLAASGFSQITRVCLARLDLFGDRDLVLEARGTLIAILLRATTSLTCVTYELVCSKCGYAIYSGFDLRSPNDILKPSGYKCKKCGAKLAPENFKVEVMKLEGRFT